MENLNKKYISLTLNINQPYFLTKEGVNKICKAASRVIHELEIRINSFSFRQMSKIVTSYAHVSSITFHVGHMADKPRYFKIQDTVNFALSKFSFKGKMSNKNWYDFLDILKSIKQFDKVDMRNMLIKY